MTKTQDVITLAGNLKEFFTAEITTTAERQGVSISLNTTQYLGNVLARFSHSHNFFKEDGSKATLPTLSLLWLESVNKQSGEQYFHMQQLGDLALFTSGFFAERIDRSLVDLDFYRAMGGMAYERAGKIHETLLAEEAINIFFELSSRFRECTEIFTELSDKSLLGSDRDLLLLYQKWLKSGSKHLTRLLNENGIIASKKASENS